MRLGVVVRSVAILVAAPLLALPAGGAEDDVPTSTRARERPAVSPSLAARPAPVQGAVVDAHLRSEPVAAAKPASPVRLVPTSFAGWFPYFGPSWTSSSQLDSVHSVRVVVDCAKDGCVVQNGLDVLVVGP